MAELFENRVDGRRRKLWQLVTAVFLFLFLFAGRAYAYSAATTIGSVTIDADSKSSIQVSMSSSNRDMSGTDGKIYVFEIKPYQTDLSMRKDPLASADAADQMNVSFDLDAGPGEKRLYSAFVAAVKVGSRYEIVSNRYYITNPEVLAANQDAQLNNGKKGLRVDPNLLDDALSLNIKHAGVDIPTQRFFGSGISYSFEGKTYQINASLINQLDQEVKRLSDSGVAVTAILLNGWNTTVTELNPVGVSELPTTQAMYYQFNVETEGGFRAVKAMASYLAKRYNGKNGHGKITSWVIGNEIDNQYWNYAGDYDVSTYVHKFQRAFRVFYTAIKSESANDNVMFSIDHYWNMYPEAAPVSKYKGKDVVEWFNNWDYAEGRIDWGLALHPYSYPMSKAAFWDDEETGKVTQDVDSPIVNFQNIHVITDFMQNEAIRNPKGEVRTIFLTEQGFTSTYQNQKDTQEEQAAAVAYSYYIVENNPYIKAYLLSRQEDSADETTSGLAFGLSYFEGTAMIHKQAHDVFKNIDNPSLTLQTSEFAKSVIGITDWNQVIPGFKAPGQS